MGSPQASRLGQYELIRKIAAGGMAEIFLARQRGHGGFFRDVVIKRLFRHLAEHPRQLRMFQDEGRLLSALAHPNIPQVYDLAHTDGYWYLAMEHVEGWTVADVWMQGARGGQPMPLEVALGIVVQICEALHHAHERTDRARRPLRIVHRDVTPQNVMVTRDGVAKLMDFGVAQTSARRDTDAGAVRGTFSYMAPEQVRAKPLDKRADVFAVGVILYELTTGTRLFKGSDVQVMTMVVEQDAPPPSSRIPGYPPELEGVVMAALERERSRRTPSAAHLARQIEDLALRAGLAIGPRTISRYVSRVIPAEPIREESLALVAEPPIPELAEDPTTEVRPDRVRGMLELDEDREPARDTGVRSLAPSGGSAPGPIAAAPDAARPGASEPSTNELSLDDLDEDSTDGRMARPVAAPTAEYVEALEQRFRREDDEEP